MVTRTIAYTRKFAVAASCESEAERLLQEHCGNICDIVNGRQLIHQKPQAKMMVPQSPYHMGLAIYEVSMDMLVAGSAN